MRAYPYSATRMGQPEQHWSNAHSRGGDEKVTHGWGSRHLECDAHGPGLRSCLARERRQPVTNDGRTLADYRESMDGVEGRQLEGRTRARS